VGSRAGPDVVVPAGIHTTVALHFVLISQILRGLELGNILLCSNFGTVSPYTHTHTHL